MERKRNRKGFTLAELLIVVAIIAVLVAIAIPVFTRQLEKSREATDQANIRAAYAELVTGYLEKDISASLKVPVKQTQASWQCSGNAPSILIADGVSGAGIAVTARTSGNYIVSINDVGKVTVSGE